MSFSLLHDRLVPLTKSDKEKSKYFVETCCPSMDLIGFASASQLCVYRSIKWETLMDTTACGATCLVWRPDGKILAGGQEDGVIVLFDVESGEEIVNGEPAVRPHKNAITALQWISFQGVDEDSLLHRSRLLLSTLSATSQSLELLASGDSTAIVTLTAFGKLPVGCIDLSGANGDSRVSLIQLSPDIKFLLAVLDNPVTKECKAVTIDTASLNENASQLKMVAHYFSIFSEQVEVIQDAIEQAKKEWEGGIEALDNHFKPLRRQLECFERSNSAEQELFIMLTCGVASPALEHYVGELDESKLTKLAKTLDTMCANLERLLVHDLYRSTETLVFYLHDLSGFADWTKKFGPTGLSTEVVKKLLHSAQRLLLKIQEVPLWIHEARANFAELNVWLHTVHRKTNRNDPQEVLKPLPPVDVDRLVTLLSGELAHPHITSQFVCLEPREAVSSSPDQEWDFSKDNSSKTLQEIVEDMQQLWKRAFYMVSDAVSSSFRPVGNAFLDATDMRLVDATSTENGFLLATALENSKQVTIFLLTGDNNAREWSQLMIDDARSFTDVKFYNAESILIVYVDSEGQTVMVLVSVSNDDGATEILKKRVLFSSNSIHSTGLVCQGKRGIAAVFTSNFRSMVFDIEDDDDEETEDGEDEEEDTDN